MTLTMPSLDYAAEKIAQFEGYRQDPYLDSAGIWTVGFGSTHLPDGTQVTKRTKPVTPDIALAYLQHDLVDAAKNLWEWVKREPTGNQWSAMLSLAYNVGWPAIARSTLVALFNSGETVLAARQFLVWDKIHQNGELVVSPGLADRRRAEMNLFNLPDNMS